jgi:four helix bundle protein
MAIESFKDLRTWRESKDLVVEIYKITRSFPNDERFGLTSQLRRAAVLCSVKYCRRNGTRYYKRFC